MHTYFVAKYHTENDPRPKFLAGNTPLDALLTLQEHGVQSTDSQYLVTIEARLDPFALHSADHCSICNNWEGEKVFCGWKVQHIVKANFIDKF
jgi:hypothetical protein